MEDAQYRFGFVAFVSSSCYDLSTLAEYKPFWNVQGYFDNPTDRKRRERSSHPIFCSPVHDMRFDEPLVRLHIHNWIWDDAKAV